MIQDDQFLRQIAPIANSSLFVSPYAREVARWTAEYFEKYNSAPREHISDIFLLKANERLDAENINLLREFLSRLANGSKKVKNRNFLIAQAVKYFKIRSLTLLRDDLSDSLLRGDTMEGESLISNYRRVEQFGGEAPSVLQNSELFIDAFLSTDETLFRFPGALGEVCGNFSRGDFVGWLGAMGRGKTWWMIFTGFVAMRVGLKVLFLSLEMSQNQLARRIWQGLVGGVRDDNTEVAIPYFSRSSGKRKWDVEVEIRKVKKVDVSNISKKQEKFRRVFRGGDFKVRAFPAYSLSIGDVEHFLDNLYYFDEYVPDVLIVDYGDIFKPPSFRMEYRHQLDSVWKTLRAIAQERDMLVVTASQTTRKALGGTTDEGTVSEDIRKLAHVSKMLGINQTKEERDMGVVKIGLLKERDGRITSKRAVVLQSLEIGRPYLDSRFEDDVEDLRKKN